MTAPSSDHHEELLGKLGRARHVAVLTGAGISAASGIPTFRGKNGLWKNRAVEDLATPEAFQNNPSVVWEWYASRRRMVADAKPNAAHRALANLADLVERLSIITQNVDGLHGRTPLPSDVELVEMHGSLWRVRCVACRREREDLDVTLGEGAVPRCPCGGLERPGVVWFGEELAPHALERAHSAALEANVFLVVGTSALVHPAASLADVAAQAGAFVAEFNLEPSAVAGACNAQVTGPCEETLPALVAGLAPGRRGD